VEEDSANLRYELCVPIASIAEPAGLATRLGQSLHLDQQVRNELQIRGVVPSCRRTGLSRVLQYRAEWVRMPHGLVFRISRHNRHEGGAHRGACAGAPFSPRCLRRGDHCQIKPRSVNSRRC
jgi:hypothetical protein